MLLGFVFFFLQLLFVVAIAYLLFFCVGAFFRFVCLLLFVAKFLSYLFVVYFFAGSWSLVDFFLGALLSFVLFVCFLSYSFKRFFVG